MDKLNLYQKISEVMKEVSYLQKDDAIKFGTTSYKAISEEKVTSTIREQLVKVGLVILPIEQEHFKVDNLTTVNVKYKIVNVENGEFIEVVSSGTGVDTQDKGVGKAMTYAYKYMLLRTFAIPTGEDPDKTSSAELDEKLNKETKKEPSKDDTKVKLEIIEKYKQIHGDEKGVADYVKSQQDKGYNLNQINAYLTKQLTNK